MLQGLKISCAFLLEAAMSQAFSCSVCNAIGVRCLVEVSVSSKDSGSWKAESLSCLELNKLSPHMFSSSVFKSVIPKMT